MRWGPGSVPVGAGVPGQVRAHSPLLMGLLVQLMQVTVPGTKTPTQGGGWGEPKLGFLHSLALP